MKTIYIPENHLRSIFNTLTLTDDSHAVLNNVITRFDHDYSKFMYGIFSAYNRVCISMMDEHCEMSRDELRGAMEKLIRVRQHINPANIFVADKLDLLYGVSCTGDVRNVKFKDFMYEDIYSRLENLVGIHRASQYMEDIFEAIEFVTGMIEGNLIAISNTSGEEDGNMVFYLDATNEGLVFIII